MESKCPVSISSSKTSVMCLVAQSASCKFRRDTPKLSKEEVADLLPAVPDWAANEDRTSISKAFVAKNFKAGVMPLIGHMDGCCRGRKLRDCVYCSNSILYGSHGSCRGRGAPSRPASDQLQRCHGKVSSSCHEMPVMFDNPYAFLSAQTRVSCKIRSVSAMLRQCWVWCGAT